MMHHDIFVKKIKTNNKFSLLSTWLIFHGGWSNTVSLSKLWITGSYIMDVDKLTDDIYTYDFDPLYNALHNEHNLEIIEAIIQLERL